MGYRKCISSAPSRAVGGRGDRFNGTLGGIQRLELGEMVACWVGEDRRGEVEVQRMQGGRRGPTRVGRQ